MKDKKFLKWIHDRLRFLHEDPRLDYMHKLRAIINTIDEEQETPNITSNPDNSQRVETEPMKPTTIVIADGVQYGIPTTAYRAIVGDFERRLSEVVGERDELLAQVARLRDEMLKYADHTESLEELSAQELSECTFYDAAEALRKVANELPEQSLADHDAAVIEEAASRVAEKIAAEDSAEDFVDELMREVDKLRKDAGGPTYRSQGGQE